MFVWIKAGLSFSRSSPRCGSRRLIEDLEPDVVARHCSHPLLVNLRWTEPYGVLNQRSAKSTISFRITWKHMTLIVNA